MRVTWVLLIALLIALTAGAIFWLSRSPRSQPSLPGGGGGVIAAGAEPLRIGLIPERDIFQQRRRYRALADYLSLKLARPVELVTNNTYEAVLADFANRTVDAAFLGSFVSVLAMDRYGAQPLLKPEIGSEVATYRGIIFVRDDSPIRSIDDLTGHSLALVKATTAGDLFPISELMRRGLCAAANQPQIKWVGTHDAVIREVVEGRADAGSAKDLRLFAYEREHQAPGLRRLATSAAVPNNALVVREDLPEDVAAALGEVLRTMDGEAEGREVLAAFGAERFVPCAAAEYDAVYEMVQTVGMRWSMLEVSGPPPRREDPAAGGA